MSQPLRFKVAGVQHHTWLPPPPPRYLMSFSVLRLIFVTYACTLAFQREVGPLLCEPGKTRVPQTALVCSCSLRTLHLDTHVLWMILRKCGLEILCTHNLIWKRNWAPQWQHTAFFSEDAAFPSTYFRLLRNKIVWFSPPSFASCTCVCAALSRLVLMKERGKHCHLWNTGCGLAHACWELNPLDPVSSVLCLLN